MHCPAEGDQYHWVLLVPWWVCLVCMGAWAEGLHQVASICMPGYRLSLQDIELLCFDDLCCILHSHFNLPSSVISQLGHFKHGLIIHNVASCTYITVSTPTDSVSNQLFGVIFHASLVSKSVCVVSFVLVIPRK